MFIGSQEYKAEGSGFRAHGCDGVSLGPRVLGSGVVVSSEVQAGGSATRVVFEWP